MTTTVYARALGALAIALVLGAGCVESPADPPRRTLCIEQSIGAPDAPVEAALVALDGDAVVDTDGHVPLGRDVDGGTAALLSVRARHLDGCAVALVVGDGTIRTGTFVELRPRDDGWGRPDAANRFGFVVIPLASGESRSLRINVEDAAGRAASWTMVVTGK